MNFKLLFIVILCLIGVNCESEDAQNEPETTIVLTDENFAEILKTNNFFVMFFAPW